jgi:AP-2 complex subunit mu-1
MISMIMVLNQKGDVMISRQYRDDVSRAAADSFRLQVSLVIVG